MANLLQTTIRFPIAELRGSFNLCFAVEKHILGLYDDVIQTFGSQKHKTENKDEKTATPPSIGAKGTNQADGRAALYIIVPPYLGLRFPWHLFAGVCIRRETMCLSG